MLVFSLERGNGFVVRSKWAGKSTLLRLITGLEDRLLVGSSVWGHR